MVAGLHVENGHHLETVTPLMQTYVMPVLVYGLEVVLPKPKSLDILDKLYKKFMKMILSVSANTADSTILILSGTLSVKTVIHNRILTLFVNICRLPNSI